MQGIGPQKPLAQASRTASVPPAAGPRHAAATPPAVEAAPDSFVKAGADTAGSRSDATSALEQAQRLRSVRRGRAEGPAEARPPSGMRPEHVRSALLEANRELMDANPAGAADKLQKLKLSPFAFFRGTADLFYRDLAGTDLDKPRVLSNGDVHPENFGLMKGADGKAVFGLNDFDEASHAPFTWDLERGATGLELAARERRLAPAERKRVVEEFTKSYVEALRDAADSKLENEERLTQQNSPKILEKLFEKAKGQSRKDFLAERVDLKKGAFLRTKEIEPLSHRRAEFQVALDRYREGLPAEARGKAGEFRVKDVAAKSDSGTGSLGTERYYVLIEGKTKAAEDDLILEVKEARPSVLARYAGGASSLPHESEGARIAAAGRVQVVDGDPLLGHTSLGGKSFLVRERSPLKQTADLQKMDAGELRDYARVLGRTLGLAHARSDEVDRDLPGSAEGRILDALDRKRLPEQMAGLAASRADQATADYEAFRDLLARDAFQPR